MAMPTLTASDLDEMRRAAIEYYQRGPHERVNAFVPELRRGAVMLDVGVPRVGIWKAEMDDGHIVLVRHPPISPVMVYFGIVFKRTEAGWLVEGEYERTDYLNLPDDLLELLQQRPGL